MAIRVYRMRNQGRKPSAGRPIGGDGHAGVIGIHAQLGAYESVTRATLSRPGTKEGDVIPPLHEPVLVTLTNQGLMLRGFESIDGAAYVQEWHCVFE